MKPCTYYSFSEDIYKHKIKATGTYVFNILFIPRYAEDHIVLKDIATLM